MRYRTYFIGSNTRNKPWIFQKWASFSNMTSSYNHDIPPILTKTISRCLPRKKISPCKLLQKNLNSGPERHHVGWDYFHSYFWGDFFFLCGIHIEDEIVFIRSGKYSVSKLLYCRLLIQWIWCTVTELREHTLMTSPLRGRRGTYVRDDTLWQRGPGGPILIGAFRNSVFSHFLHWFYVYIYA